MGGIIMKHFAFGIMAVFVLLAPMAGYAAQKQAGSAQNSTIQIVLEKASTGTPEAMIINAEGVKSALTLGTLLNATAESWLNGPVAVKAIDPNVIALIRIYKEGGRLVSYLEDNHGRREPLNLGNLIAGSAEMYPGCNARQISGQVVSVKLHFALNSAGHVDTLYYGPAGEEAFTLGTLVRDTSIALNQCKK
jgi:hypothetical protein